MKREREEDLELAVVNRNDKISYKKYESIVKRAKLSKWDMQIQIRVRADQTDPWKTLYVQDVEAKAISEIHASVNCHDPKAVAVFNTFCNEIDDVLTERKALSDFQKKEAENKVTERELNKRQEALKSQSRDTTRARRTLQKRIGGSSKSVVVEKQPSTSLFGSVSALWNFARGSSATVFKQKEDRTMRSAKRARHWEESQPTESQLESQFDETPDESQMN